MNSIYSRRNFLHTTLAAGVALAAPRGLNAAMTPLKPNFTVADYHVHLSPTLTIEQAVERAGTKAGNKGWDAAMAAIELSNLQRRLPKR